MGTVAPWFDGAELTRIYTRLANTVLAVLRHCIAGDRTIFTGRTDNLDDIAVVGNSRRFSLSQAYPLTDDLSFLINTAAELRRGSRDQLKRDLILALLQFSVKSQTCNLLQNCMFDFDYICICVPQNSFPP